MSEALKKIDFHEAELFYKSPFSFVDYTLMQSFSLIKSTVEVFAYYGASPFSPEDVRDFFQRLGIVQQKNGRVFVPSPKKVRGVLECYLGEGKLRLEERDGLFYILSWDTLGYSSELQRLNENLSAKN